MNPIKPLFSVCITFLWRLRFMCIIGCSYFFFLVVLQIKSPAETLEIYVLQIPVLNCKIGMYNFIFHIF